MISIESISNAHADRALENFARQFFLQRGPSELGRPCHLPQSNGSLPSKANFLLDTDETQTYLIIQLLT